MVTDCQHLQQMLPVSPWLDCLRFMAVVLLLKCRAVRCVQSRIVCLLSFHVCMFCRDAMHLIRKERHATYRPGAPNVWRATGAGQQTEARLGVDYEKLTTGLVDFLKVR